MSKNYYIPGTTVPYKEEEDTKPVSVLEPIFAVTKGLSLAQVRELTGLESSTIQNWVKRGWVSNPHGKRYNQIQVSRILIINILRDCLKLESIAQLMGFLNGSVEDRSDDIIPENELYYSLCSLITELDKHGCYSYSIIRKLVEKGTESYVGPQADSRDHLRKGLEIMLLAYASSRMKQDAEEHLGIIMNTINGVQ